MNTYHATLINADGKRLCLGNVTGPMQDVDAPYFAAADLRLKYPAKDFRRCTLVLKDAHGIERGVSMTDSTVATLENVARFVAGPFAGAAGKVVEA